jgi:hypothetical protein
MDGIARRHGAPYGGVVKAIGRPTAIVPSAGILERLVAFEEARAE